ncbi:MAG: RnfH family protein [Betaproteobacteria bacterium]
MTSDATVVEVVFALPTTQTVVRLELEAGVTVREAIERSGLLDRYPGIDIDRQDVGIWGRKVKLDTPLANGDRVELYRPLEVDPKEARRLRVRR